MPEPYWQDDMVTLYLGDCLGVLAEMETASVDAIVTDPPAAIGFMGKDWDSNLGDRDMWIKWLAKRMEQAARVLKPGGHALVWALPRTSGWTQIALEDAGLEVRDCIPHLFGSGFPKSLDVSKAIDKLKRRDYVLAAVELGLEVPGNNLHDWTKAEHSPGDEWWERFKAHLSPADWQRLERAVTGRAVSGATAGMQRLGPSGIKGGDYEVTAAATEDAARWDGWGTALKPGQELWWLARKPIAGTIAANVLEHGTGALNIAGCRVGAEARTNNAGGSSSLQRVSRVEHGYRPTVTATVGEPSEVSGRWPPNLLLTHSAACELIGSRQVRGDVRSGQERGERQGGFADVGADRGSNRPNGHLYGDQAVEVFDCAPDCPVGELDRQSGVRAAGSAVSGSEPSRRMGVNGIYGDAGNARPEFAGYADSGGASRFYPVFRYQAKAPASERPRGEDGYAHPTVKSVPLTSWLVRLITPPGGTVLDLFAGSGPTAEACVIHGFRCVLIEKDPASCDLIRKRLSKPIQPDMFGGVA